ncbi:MAG: AAA family ATPase [Lachnospiraceae bacterium]
MEQTQILAVMGSSGSGKTFTSVKLANELALLKKNVIIIALDSSCPVVPYLLSGDTTHEVSIGELLTKMQVSQNDVLKALVTVPTNPYISLLSYKLGESISSYPKIVPSKVVEVLTNIRGIADYIIVDCSSMIEADVATIVALSFADKVLKLGTSDLKGISYFYTADRLLADSKFKKDKNIIAISNLKDWQEWENVASQYGGATFTIPYCKELERQFSELSLFEKLKEDPSSVYNLEISNMTRHIFGLEIPKAEKKKKEKTAATETKKPFRNPFSKNKGEF